MKEPSVENVNYKNIWWFKQNKPSLIAKDFETLGVNSHKTYSILLARGVFKWFSVRRNLIKLKDDLKRKVNNTIKLIIVVAKENNDVKEIIYLRGYLKGLQESRDEIRKLCHSERWQYPDFDCDARNWLKYMEHNGKGKCDV